MTRAIGWARQAATTAATATMAIAATGAAAQPAGSQDVYRPGVQSYWAFVNIAGWARAAPNMHARRVGRLSLRTEDRTDELVLIRAQAQAPQGGIWYEVELPIRPIGRVGWVPASMLGAVRSSDRWIKVDRHALTLSVVKDGAVVFTAAVGVGRPTAPTPSGEFYVRDVLRQPNANGFYGPIAFGLSAKSRVLTDWPGGGVIGIHGTNAPRLIPGRPSHGCIRMRNADILRLAQLIHIGDPVTIS